MTSRERILTAVEHHIPDRVPIDLGGSYTSSISIFSYIHLRKKLGTNTTPSRILNLFNMIADIEIEVLDKLKVDTAMVPKLNYPFGTQHGNWAEWQLNTGDTVLVPQPFSPVRREDGALIVDVNEDGLKAMMPKDGYYFDILEDTYPSEPPSLNELRFNFWSEEELEYCARMARELRQNTDKALIADLSINLEKPPISHEEWYIMMLTDPEYLKAYYDKTTEWIIEVLKQYRDAVGENIDILPFYHDLGMQSGPLFSIETFREILKPYFKKINNWIKANTEWKIFFHSCGSVYEFIPDIIDSGFDILNPVQCSAANMEPRRLKDEFGNQICFWGGGVDTQKTLPFGSIEEVENEVRERVEIFKPGGGFVFNTIHNIQPNVPPENILAIYRTVEKYGKY